MAIYKIFPEKDATLYTQNTLMNTGLDEILEASTYLLDDAAQASRYLIKFSTNELEGAFDSYVSGSGISNLFGRLTDGIATNPTNLVNGTFENQPLTSSISNGIGARAKIVVSSNTITLIDVQNRGKNYKLNDRLDTPPLLTTDGSYTTASITLATTMFQERNYQTNLKNYAAVVTNLNSTSYLKIYPISQSWDMGTGRFGNSPVTTNGCSWRDKIEGVNWTNGTFAA